MTAGNRLPKPTATALTDTHAHLELEPLFKDAAQVVERAKSAGVQTIITVGIDLEDARLALDVAERFPDVFACVGFHPHNARSVGRSGIAEMEQLARHPKVVGYGEIGLDFFRNRSPHPVQKSVFFDQLFVAKSLGKPVVIHLRNAYKKGLEMLEKAAPFPEGGAIHCFSGDENDARRALNLGFYISIPGTITYKKNDKLRSIVRTLPEDRILLETDCPFLSPEPLKGKTNEPAHMIYTAMAVAECRGVTIDAIAESTTTNAARLFKLPHS
jgi:TatD DNase family protein